jgi:hypothetical protein
LSIVYSRLLPSQISQESRATTTAVVELPALICVFGLSPSQPRQAADANMSGPPLNHSNKPEKFTRCLQQQVSTQLEQLNNEHWSCRLPFPGIRPISGPPCKQCPDILDLCRRGHPMTGHVFRFSSDLYPPTEEGRKELLRELRCVAKLSGGIDLISVGGFSLKTILTT